MNKIFIVFLSLSLSGSLVTLLFHLAEPLYKDRFSKTWQYYIFLIVIIRLLVPFGPEASLVGMIFSQTGNYAYIEANPAANALESNYPPETSFLEIPPRPESSANNPNYLRNTVKAAIDLLWLGWLIPALILLLHKIIVYNRSVRSIRIRCAKVDDAHVLDMYRNVSRSMEIKHPPILTHDESVSAPMLVGAAHPFIVLPNMCLTDKDMCFVFQHELTHYKRLDIVYKWLTQITVCLHWYNPIVYYICRKINRNCELSCDEAVMMRLDISGKYAYGDMLLETIKIQKNSPLPVLPLMLNEDTKLIKERLAAIMKFKKVSKLSKAASLTLAVFFLCGAICTGAYAQANDAPASPISESSNISIKEIPDIVKYDNVSAQTKLQFGPYKLNAASTYSVMVSWHEGNDTLKLILADMDGYQTEYILSNGKSVNINVPKNGLYYFYSPRNRETGDIQKLSIKFSASDVLAPAPTAIANTQAVVYESVEMRRYTESSGSIPAHPYIHDIKTNHTNKKIIEHQRGMLAYDKDGKPLKIDWFSADSERNNTYYFLYDWGSKEILPGKTDDVFGGWSLNVYGNDPVVNEIAYVLYCDKEITFEDGTVWKNPDFDSWRKTYEGKTIEVKILESYYPYAQKIVF